MCVRQNWCDTRREIWPLVECYVLGSNKTTALHMSLANCGDIRWCLIWTEELWYPSSKLTPIPNYGLISVPPSNTQVFFTLMFQCHLRESLLPHLNPLIISRLSVLDYSNEVSSQTAAEVRSVTAH